MAHVGKHLVHVVLIASALLMLRLADLDLSTGALVALMVVCIAAFEGGMWLIHRRDRTRLGAH